MVNTDVPAFAAELPVSVIVPLSFPDAVRFTLLSDGVTPAGSPPNISEVCTFSPPNSVIVTMNELDAA